MGPRQRVEEMVRDWRDSTPLRSWGRRFLCCLFNVSLLAEIEMIELVNDEHHETTLFLLS